MSTPPTDFDIPSTPAGTWGTSVIRTGVPIVVGAALTWLALQLGEFVLNAQLQAGLTEVLTAGGSVAWYALLRAVEPHLPAFARGILFGSAKALSYGPVTVTPRAMIDPDSGQVTDVYTITDLPAGATVVARE